MANVEFRGDFEPVAITGVGVMSPLGKTGPETFEAVLNGKNALSEPSEESGIKDIGIGAVGVIDGIDNKWVAERTGINFKTVRQMDRSTQLLASAGAEAMAMAGIADGQNSIRLVSDELKHRTAVIMGTGAGGFINFLNIHNALVDEGKSIKPSDVMPVLGERTATLISMESGAKRATLPVLGACAAGNVAMVMAVNEIRSGRADVVLTGGSEAVVHRVPIAMFNALGVLDREQDPENASRPYDESRDGFVMTEAAAFFVLESMSHAKKRAAEIKAVISGASITGDGEQGSATLMDVDGPKRAIEEALSQTSGFKKMWIKAHATATKEGDGKELEVYSKLFSPDQILAISALKSHFGHSIGASGPLENAVALYALNEGTIPGTAKLKNVISEGKKWPILGPDPLRADIDTALLCSYGFGGENAVLVMQKTNK